MSDNKGLSAFLNKNKKNKKSKAKQEDEAQKETSQAQEAQNAANVEEQKKNTPVQKDDSSDEEVDELEVANKQIDNVNIKENKDVGGGKLGEDKKKGFGYEDEQVQQNDKSKKPTGAKFGEKEIKFSRPTFSKKNQNKIGNRDDFAAGLDDLDDEGKEKKELKRNTTEGGREFINLGSTSRAAGHDKEESKREAVKPTFRGKLNLTKTGKQPEEENQGVVKDYDFRNVYKAQGFDREEKGQNERRDGENTRGFRGGRGRRGQNFGDREQKGDEDGDEGFETITSAKRKQKKRFNDDQSSEEEEPKGWIQNSRSDGGMIKRNEGAEQIRNARVERGGNRGGRGGHDQ